MDHISVQRVPTTEDRLVVLRALRSWTGNATVADELTQQTMIECWKSPRQPEEAEWRPWLFGVARNVLFRWRRGLARDLRRSIALPESDALLGAAADDIDIDDELEQQEVVQLLHDILDELPSETRDVLLLKYIHDRPQAEVATQLGLNEKALEGRLHRGKQKLRTHILTYRPDTALSLGIVSEPNTWQATTIWCTTCGMHKLKSRWTDSGKVDLVCESCANQELQWVYSSSLIPSDVKRPSFRRLMQYFRAQTEKSVALSVDAHQACSANCGGTLHTIVDCSKLHAPDSPAVSRMLKCDTCDFNLIFENVFDVAIDTPAGVRFLQNHPRVESVRPALVTFRHADAVQSKWRAIGSPAEFVAWFHPESGHLIHTQTNSH